MDTADVLARHDRQLRRSLVPPQPGWLVEDLGRVVRTTSTSDSPFGSFVTWSDLDEGSADAVIAEQVGYFGGLGRRFEWKLYGHDRPTDLSGRLLAAGFVPEDEESLVVGEVSDVLAATAGFRPPDGVLVRYADREDDLDAIRRLKEAVWGGDGSWQVADLAAERRADPHSLHIHLAEADGEVVCAAWVRFHDGTDFATLWGGSTLPAWRGRGIYRELVRRRAVEAQERGFRFLQVDASPDSRPILELLGFHVLTWTRPFIWSPGGS